MLSVMAYILCVCLCLCLCLCLGLAGLNSYTHVRRKFNQVFPETNSTDLHICDALGQASWRRSGLPRHTVSQESVEKIRGTSHMSPHKFVHQSSSQLGFLHLTLHDALRKS